MPMPPGKYRTRLADGVWLIDWRVVERIWRAHYRAHYRYTMRQKKPLENGFGLPEIYNLEVDFDAANARAETQVAQKLEHLRRAAAGGRLAGAELGQELARTQRETNSLSERFLSDLRDISRGNMERTRSKEALYGRLKWGAEVVRDLSAEIIVIGSSVVLAPVIAGGAAVSGGAAGLVALGGGSALKGIGKFQDTGSRDSALLEAAGSFGFALVPGGKEAGMAKRAVLFAAKGAVATCQGLAESRDARDGAGKKSLGEVLTIAVGKTLIETGAEKLVSAAPVEKMLRKATIPVSVLIRKRREVGKALVERAAESALGKTGEAGLEHAHGERSFENLVAFGSHVTHTIVDDAIERAPR